MGGQDAGNDPCWDTCYQVLIIISVELSYNCSPIGESKLFDNRKVLMEYKAFHKHLAIKYKSLQILF